MHTCVVHRLRYMDEMGTMWQIRALTGSNMGHFRFLALSKQEERLRGFIAKLRTPSACTLTPLKVLLLPQALEETAQRSEHSYFQDPILHCKIGS